MWAHRRTVGVLAALALACGAARAVDVHKADPPDPGFLEFLGSVDRLSDVMPDYLPQPDARGKTADGISPVTPPPPQPAQPPNTANGPGGHNNG